MADEDSARIEALVAQVSSSSDADVDAKIDALAKLEAEFQQATKIHEPESTLNVLKSVLRTSNQHLTAAAISVVPPLLPLLVSHSGPVAQIPSPTASTSTASIPASSSMDIFTLRHVLNALLPSGGLFERLGDREKIQTKAHESLVILGGIIFRCGGSSKSSKASSETPLMTFERFLRESGLGSKVWKVREQSILILAEIRKHHHLFPLRPYVPLLVACLEDTDAHVRECARKSVVEIFSGPGVSDAARADLKKEMSKKGVRKGIVESVLSGLLGASNRSINSPPSRDSPETEDSKSGYVPPSVALQNRKTSGAVPVRAASTSAPKPLNTPTGGSRLPSRPQSRAAGELPATPITDTAEISPVYIASSKDLEHEFASMEKAFEGKESEHNWADRERSITRVRGMLKGEVHSRYLDTFIACLKDNFIQWSLKGAASLRTTLASHACSLYSELAIDLGHSMDPFTETLFVNLLKMTSLTKKIIAQKSQSSVTALITHTSGHPRVLIPLLWQYMQEKNVASRTYAAGHIKTLLEVHGQRGLHAIEAHGGKETIEKSVKKAVLDANPSVREIGRPCFWVFHSIWPDRGVAVLSGLDGTSRKQLEKACPSGQTAASIPPSSPPTKTAKKSSVAAAIAASRAKAKAIATAPPSLRHQATSGTHVSGASVRRPSSPGVSRLPTSRPSSPLRMSASPTTSPVSPRTTPTKSRIVSSTARSPKASSPPPTTSADGHSRTSSSSSKGSPESPSESTAAKRRLSSPLAFASPTSPSKRASIIRQSLAGAGANGSNGHTTSQAPPSPPDSRTSPTPRSPGSRGSRRLSGIPAPGRHVPAPDNIITGLNSIDQDSLLLAQAIPVPEDESDSDEENLLSFSAPFEIAKAEAASRHATPARIHASVARGVVSPPRSTSQARSISPKSAASRQGGPLSPKMMSHDNAGDQSLIIEDALRATAEQAESAAERLLEELVDPEDSSNHVMIPHALIPGSSARVPATPSKKGGQPVFSPPTTKTELPATPANRGSTVLRQAALFKNSPAYNGRSSSLLDMLDDRKQDSAWWIKRQSLVSRRPQRSLNYSPQEVIAELRGIISALEDGTATVDTLEMLTWLCLDNGTTATSPMASGPNYTYPLSPSPSSGSAPSLMSDLWEQDRNLDTLCRALFKFLHPSQKSALLETGLMVVWQLLESVGAYLEGHEAEIFALLLNVRYCNDANVFEATNTIRDSLTTTIECVYGLTTMHGALKTFQAEPLPTIPGAASSEIASAKTQTVAFGLLALGKFIVRLPSEILEEELPRLRPTLISCLNETSVQGGLVVREAAAAAIIAAQLVLKDEGNLFVLLDGLRDDKKNLLTYLFDKHGVRGNGLHAEQGNIGLEKLEREMRRLDTRTSTPPRAMPAS